MKILVTDSVRISEDDKVPAFHSPLCNALNGHTRQHPTLTPAATIERVTIETI